MMAGSPLHLTTQPMEWWIQRFEAAGATLIEHDRDEEELYFRVGPEDAAATG